jgi:hypothetical protein
MYYSSWYLTHSNIALMLIQVITSLSANGKFQRGNGDLQPSAFMFLTDN